MWLKRSLVFLSALFLLSLVCYGKELELQVEIINLEKEMNNLGNYLQELKENNERLTQELTIARQSLQTMTTLYKEQKNLIEEQQRSYRELNENCKFEKSKKIIFMLATIIISTAWMVEKIR